MRSARYVCKWFCSGQWKQNALKADKTYEKFNNFLPLYQRVRTDTIQKKKKQRDLFDSRLQKYIENTKKGIMYCERNDNGR